MNISWPRTPPSATLSAKFAARPKTQLRKKSSDNSLTYAHNQCRAKHADRIVAGRKDDETDHATQNGPHDAVKRNLGHFTNQRSCDHDASDCCPEFAKRHTATLQA